MSNLASIKRIFTSCNKPVIKLVTTTDCTDSIGDSFYGTGDVVDGSEGVSSFPFQKITNLRGFIKDIPREITRQNSINCRTQKVISTVKYDLQGADAYPPWKMRELEEMFHGKQIIVDGYDVKYAGGTMFTELGSTCTPVFRLRTTIEECRRQQIYGCADECIPVCYYFRIPANIVTQNFFNEAGIQIASTYSQLLTWYRSQTNVTQVIEVNGVLQIACDYYKVFKVIATGYIPSFLFFDNPSQTNKVFGVSLDCSQPDYSKLCGSINNSSCGLIDLDIPVVFELMCGEITITDTVVFEIGSGCSIAPNPMWVQYTGDTDIMSSGSLRTIDLSLFNSTYTGTPVNTGTIDHTVAVGEECSFGLVVPSFGTIINIDVNGTGIGPDEWTYNTMTGDLTFDPCLTAGDVVRVHYQYGTASIPSLSGEVIAVITGSSCIPLTTQYQGHANNSTIPVGANVVIEPTGNVKWYGPVTSADATGAVIQVIGVSYTV